MDGFGYHEIIVETPIHNRFLAAMRAEEIEAILRAYRDRYVALKEDPRVKFFSSLRIMAKARGPRYNILILKSSLPPLCRSISGANTRKQSVTMMQRDGASTLI